MALAQGLIFVSYCRDDQALVQEKVEDLERAGHEVWFDQKSLSAGDNWPHAIDHAISKARQFLVFVSEHSVHNWRTQQDEINKALAREQREELRNWILPIRLSECRLPRGLENRHAIDAFHPGVWRAWVQGPASKLKTGLTRASTLPAGGVALKLPVFFPSLSTAAKTTVGVEQHMELLLALKHPQFLVSAADIYFLRKNRQTESRKIAEHLTRARNQRQVVLLDSGNYEKYWQKLDWTVEQFHEVLSYTPVSLAFCFDDLEPPDSIEKSIVQIEQSTARDRRENEMESMLPIVHAQKRGDFPFVCKAIAERLQPILIGVPERELGAGIVDRVRSVVAIRKELDSTGHYHCLHLLGTGNPISLLAFYLAGADSFDGLEWCQTVVDVESARLHHLSHYDLVEHQSPFGELDAGTAAKCLAHNLRFYRYWMAWLQNSPREELVSALARFVGRQAWSRLARALNEA